MLRRPFSYVKVKTCLTKNGKRALNLISFVTLRNKLQHCTHAPSITFLTPPSRLHEETATKSLNLKRLASLAERSRQGSRSLQVCWAALSCSDFHFIFIDVSLILHWFSMICHWFCIDFHWFSIDLQWCYHGFILEKRLVSDLSWWSKPIQNQWQSMTIHWKSI